MYFDPDHPFASEMGWWGVTAPLAATKTMPRDYFRTVLPRLPPDQQPLQCTQHPGEVVFVPSGYWHTVVNTAYVDGIFYLF